LKAKIKQLEGDTESQGEKVLYPINPNQDYDQEEREAHEKGKQCQTSPEPKEWCNHGEHWSSHPPLRNNDPKDKRTFKDLMREVTEKEKADKEKKKADEERQAEKFGIIEVLEQPAHFPLIAADSCIAEQIAEAVKTMRVYMDAQKKFQEGEDERLKIIYKDLHNQETLIYQLNE
jgi:hypothetical protein